MLRTNHMQSMPIMQLLVVFVVVFVIAGTNAEEYVDTVSGGSWEIVVPKGRWRGKRQKFGNANCARGPSSFGNRSSG